MTEVFHTLSMFENVPSARFPAAATYDPGVVPPGTWPSEHGSPAQTSTAGEPLAAGRWQVAWEASLDAVGAPRSVLVGANAVVVSGDTLRAVFSDAGEPLGTVRRVAGGAFLDVTGRRLLCDDPESGLSTYRLDKVRRDARLMTMFPDGHVTTGFLEGPGVLVLSSIRDFPLGPPPEAVVEAIRVHDYAKKSDTGILRGVERLGGVIRTTDARLRMAAARKGPILATPDGLRWCDWQLRTLSETPGSFRPTALASDSLGRALLVFERDGAARFSIVPPGSTPLCDLKLPVEAGMPMPPPILTPAGSIVLTPPGLYVVLRWEVQSVQHEVRASRAPAAMSANGILLLASDELLAITPDGSRHRLWRPPSPLVATPVLAGGQLYVATEDTLYALRTG